VRREKNLQAKEKTMWRERKSEMRGEITNFEGEKN
jgi:hypothetical protein